MKLLSAHGLLFTEVRIHHDGSTLVVKNVLIDTGSSAILFRTDDLAKIGVKLENTDRIVSMMGIGGIEVVIQKQVDSLEVGELSLSPFRIQLGTVDYGFGINGILGVDFLLKVGAVLDLKTLELRQG